MKISSTVMNIEAVTGFGKTIMMFESLKRILGSNKALVIVSRREIAADVERIANEYGLGDRVSACTVLNLRQTINDREPNVVVTLELYSEQDAIVAGMLEQELTARDRHFVHINVAHLPAPRLDR